MYHAAQQARSVGKEIINEGFTDFKEFDEKPAERWILQLRNFEETETTTSVCT